MIRFFKAPLTACVAVVAAAGPANAELLFFHGTAKETRNAKVESTWQLSFNYLPEAPGSGNIDAVVDAASFTINRQGVIYSWNAIKATPQSFIRVAEGLKAYTMSIDLQGPASASSGPAPGGSQSKIMLTLRSINTSPNQEATLANVSLLTAGGFELEGGFTLDDQTPFDTLSNLPLTGIIQPVPEPGSMLLLSGLGLAAGRRVLARRRQQKAKAEAETAA